MYTEDYLTGQGDGNPCWLLMFIDVKSLTFGKDARYLREYAAVIRSTNDERKHSGKNLCHLIEK